MANLYLRLPARAMADELQPGMPLYCAYALANGARLEREGVAALSELGELVGRARRVILLLAASDVTLLRVKLPPLTAAKLKSALPNLVEDQLMSDPADNVVVAGATTDDLRTVAVVQRDWLEKLSRSLLALGARSVAAVPAQACLPWEGEPRAAVAEHGADADLALRPAPEEGVGLAVQADQPELLAAEVLQSLAALAPAGALTLYVPPGRLADYQSSLHLVPTLEGRLTIDADSWARWIAGADATELDLMSGLAGSAPRWNWKPWRWPLALAAAVLLVNAIALNVDWLRERHEADALREAMTQTYRKAYPNETVIIDPLAQLRQKMTAARRDSGEFAAGDFLSLAAGLGDAWRSVAQGAPLASLQYRDRSLLLRLKPDARIDLDKLRSALAARNLTIAQEGNGTWRVESTR